MFPSCLAKIQVDSAQESCLLAFVRICLVVSLLLRTPWQHNCHHHCSMPDAGCPCCCEKTRKEHAKIIICKAVMLKRPSEAVVQADTRGIQAQVQNQNANSGCQSQTKGSASLRKVSCKCHLSRSCCHKASSPAADSYL